MTVGERIRALREEKDMSLAEVARQIGIGRSTLYKYETGTIRNIPPDNIHALANFFGVTRPYLMGWTDERNINPAKNLDMVAERMRMVPDGSTLRENAEYWKTPCSSGADCMTAATQAYRALIKFGIGRTPIYPQQIIQISRIATMISLADPAELKIIEQNTKLPAFRMDSDIVMTSMHAGKDGDRHYLFAFNREAPIGKVRMALAAELGHIYMGHSENSRNTGTLHSGIPLPLRGPPPFKQGGQESLLSIELGRSRQCVRSSVLPAVFLSTIAELGRNS